MKDWQKRALRTFLQSAVGYFCTAIVTVDWGADKAIIKATVTGIIVSAIAGGISAAMNIYDEKNDF
ncbi:MAG: hypothetical protein IIZ73_10790 [Ruminococcus sp.]|nr:hypothetical protein [Ruminococcus sp.]